MIKRVIQGSVCLAALLLVGAGTASAQVQSSSQQKCINKINKSASKVQAAQGKANSSCIKDFVKGKITGVGAAEACILDDPKDKVEGKQANVLNDESKKCEPADLPDFAYTDGVTAGTSAYQAEVDLIHDVFGNPVDPGLFICDTSPAECFCQRTASKRIEKIFRAMNKIFVKCKKAALAIGKLPQFPLGADDIGDIQRCVTDAAVSLSVAADTKGKVASATTQLSDTTDQFCDPLTLGEFDAGVCGGIDNPALTQCLRDRIECRFCRMVNAIDGAAIDCSTFSGVACP